MLGVQHFSLSFYLLKIIYIYICTQSHIKLIRNFYVIKQWFCNNFRELRKNAVRISDIYEKSKLQNTSNNDPNINSNTADCSLIISCLRSNSKNNENEYHRRMKRCGKHLQSYIKLNHQSRPVSSSKRNNYETKNRSFTFNNNWISKSNSKHELDENIKISKDEDLLNNEEIRNLNENGKEIDLLQVRGNLDSVPADSVTTPVVESSVTTLKHFSKRNQTRHLGVIKNVFGQLTNVIKGESLKGLKNDNYELKNFTLPLKLPTEIWMETKPIETNIFKLLVTKEPPMKLSSKKIHHYNPLIKACDSRAECNHVTGLPLTFSKFTTSEKSVQEYDENVQFTLTTDISKDPLAIKSNKPDQFISSITAREQIETPDTEDLNSLKHVIFREKNIRPITFEPFMYRNRLKFENVSSDEFSVDKKKVNPQISAKLNSFTDIFYRRHNAQELNDTANKNILDTRGRKHPSPSILLPDMSVSKHVGQYKIRANSTLELANQKLLYNPESPNTDQGSVHNIAQVPSLDKWHAPLTQAYAPFSCDVNSNTVEEGIPSENNQILSSSSFELRSNTANDEPVFSLNNPSVLLQRNNLVNSARNKNKIFSEFHLIPNTNNFLLSPKSASTEKYLGRIHKQTNSSAKELFHKFELSTQNGIALNVNKNSKKEMPGITEYVIMPTLSPSKQQMKSSSGTPVVNYMHQGLDSLKTVPQERIRLEDTSARKFVEAGKSFAHIKDSVASNDSSIITKFSEKTEKGINHATSSTETISFFSSKYPAINFSDYVNNVYKKKVNITSAITDSWLSKPRFSGTYRKSPDTESNASDAFTFDTTIESSIIPKDSIITAQYFLDIPYSERTVMPLFTHSLSTTLPASSVISNIRNNLNIGAAVSNVTNYSTTTEDNTHSLSTANYLDSANSRINRTAILPPNQLGFNVESVNNYSKGTGLHTVPKVVHTTDRLLPAKIYFGISGKSKSSHIAVPFPMMNPNDNWKSKLDKQYVDLEKEKDEQYMRLEKENLAKIRTMKNPDVWQNFKNGMVDYKHVDINQYINNSTTETAPQQLSEIMNSFKKYTTNKPPDGYELRSREYSEVNDTANQSVLDIFHNHVPINKYEALSNWWNSTDKLKLKSFSNDRVVDEKNNTNKQCHNIFIIGERNEQLLKAILNYFGKKENDLISLDFDDEAEIKTDDSDYKIYHSNKREVENQLLLLKPPALQTSPVALEMTPNTLQASPNNVENIVTSVDKNEELFRSFFQFVPPAVFKNFMNVYKQYEPKSKSVFVSPAFSKRSNSESRITRQQSSTDLDNSIVNTLQQLFNFQRSIPKMLIKQNTPKPEELYID